MDVTNSFQSSDRSVSLISTSLSNNYSSKTSEWTDLEERRFKQLVKLWNESSHTFLEDVAKGIPSKTITQVARQYVVHGGKFGIKNLVNDLVWMKADGPWNKVEQKSFEIGLFHFGEGKWDEISKYCVKTRTVEQVAHYGSIYCDKKNRHRSMGLLGIPSNMERTGKCDTKETNVGATSFISSVPSRPTTGVAASNRELELPGLQSSIIVPSEPRALPSAIVTSYPANTPSISTTSSLHRLSNSRAKRPSKRYKDGRYSGNVGLYSEQLPKIAYMERRSNNSLSGASIPSLLRPSPVAFSRRHSVSQLPPSTRVVNPSQNASPYSNNANSSTQLSGITATGSTSGSVLPAISDGLMMESRNMAINGVDISHPPGFQSDYAIDNQNQLLGFSVNDLFGQFTNAGVPEGFTSNTMNQTDWQFSDTESNEQLDSLIDCPLALDETSVGTDSSKVFDINNWSAGEGTTSQQEVYQEARDNLQNSL